MGKRIKDPIIKAIDGSVCPFCIKQDSCCGGCKYTGRPTICETTSDGFPFIKKLSNKWYKETYKIINDCFK